MGDESHAASAAIGGLYTLSIGAVVAFCMIAELAAIPLFLRVSREVRTGDPDAN